MFLAASPDSTHVQWGRLPISPVHVPTTPVSGIHRTHGALYDVLDHAVESAVLHAGRAGRQHVPRLSSRLSPSLASNGI